MPQYEEEGDIEAISANAPVRAAPPPPPPSQSTTVVTVVNVREVPVLPVREEPASGIPTGIAPDYGGGGGEYTTEVVASGPTILALGSFEKESACIGGILIASCVELAQASQNCENMDKCEDKDGYAVAVGCISVIMCLCYIACLKFKPGLIGRFTQYLSLFFVVWWGVGTVVMTFTHPFITTGNGYFACWGAVLLSIYYCQLAVAKLKVLGERISNAIAGNKQRKLLALVMILSYVVAFASLVLFDEHNSSTKKQTPQETWAFACGITAGALCTIYLLIEIAKPGMLTDRSLKFLAWFLVPWWMFGAGVATFDQPFPTTGNGYFCAWGAFVSSCYLAYVTTMNVSV